MSLALKKVMTSTNIRKGFFAIFIWPLNHIAMYDKMRPSQVFVNDVVEVNEVNEEEVVV